MLRIQSVTFLYASLPCRWLSISTDKQRRSHESPKDGISNGKTRLMLGKLVSWWLFRGFGVLCHTLFNYHVMDDSMV